MRTPSDRRHARRSGIRGVAWGLVLAAGCVTTPAKPPIVAGELLVRTSDPAAVTVQALSALGNRSDFRIQAVECLEKTCRVVVTRADGSAADEAFTRALAEQLGAGAAASPGVIEGVRANAIQVAK